MTGWHLSTTTVCSPAVDVYGVERAQVGQRWIWLRLETPNESPGFELDIIAATRR